MKLRLLLLISCVLLSGCYIQSLNKFYTDDLKVELPQIAGEWLPTVLAGDDVSKKNISAWKYTKDKIESYDKENIYSELEVSYFNIGDDLFMDFTAGEPSKDGKRILNMFWCAGVTQTHSLCKITFKDDSMVVIPMNPEWFVDQIEKKKVVTFDFVKADEHSNYIFTMSTEKWVSFLKTYANDKDVFSDKLKFVFRKLDKNKVVAVETAKPITPQTVIVPTHTLTVTGAVIVKQETKAFYYKKQCLSCGYVSEDQIGSGYPKDLGTLNGDFTCPKCGNKQNVRIDFK